ncbi:MAG: helix-turn-helix domain-containing protein [Marinobacterium sp.]|nr:helix-turn-helix domain-containing protein [Marinobacterium sp.]
MNNRSPTIRFYILLCEEYSQLSLTILQALLQEANQLLELPRYQLRLVSCQSQSATVHRECTAVTSAVVDETVQWLTAEQLTVMPPAPCDVVLVLGGAAINTLLPESLATVVKRHRRRGGLLVAVASAVNALARCGVLAGERASCFVEHQQQLAELYPNIRFNGNLFTFSGSVLSCAGGMATLDMLFELIDRFTPAIHDALCVRMALEHPRPGTVAQKTTLHFRYSGLGPYLVDAIELMEANIDEVLSIEEIARHCCISKRQLERLFRRHLACSPRQFYLQLRLKRARHRILNSHCPVLDVAFACGFSTTAHFSRCYKAQFGVSPREDRQLSLAG